MAPPWEMVIKNGTLTRAVRNGCHPLTATLVSDDQVGKGGEGAYEGHSLSLLAFPNPSKLVPSLP